MKIEQLTISALPDAEERRPGTGGRDAPIPVTPDKTCRVQAFGGTGKVVTYRCAPCPACGRWLTVNPAHRYCDWCGQAVRFPEEG